MRTIEYIENVVCAGENVDAKLLHDACRKREHVELRQLIMTLAMECHNTEESAAEYFGRNHATANYAKTAIADLYDTNKTWRTKIDLYRKLIESEKTFHYWDFAGRKERLVKETTELLNQIQKTAV